MDTDSKNNINLSGLEDTEQLELFLHKTLPECIEQCNQHTKQLIIQGHKELEPHLLQKSETVSKDELSKVIIFRFKN